MGVGCNTLNEKFRCKTHCSGGAGMPGASRKKILHPLKELEEQVLEEVPVAMPGFTEILDPAYFWTVR